MLRSLRLKDVEERAARVLPAGERLVAGQQVRRGKRVPKPRRGRRPRVLRGLRMPGDRWEGAKAWFWFFLAVMDLPGALFDALFDWGRKKGKPLKGGWNSLAGQFAAALHPLSKTTGVVRVVVLTDRQLRVVYVQQGRRSGELGRAESGWAVDVRQVAWLRNRDDVSNKNYELGFADGSWARVHFPQVNMDFLDGLPAPRLRHDAPVPP
ncbi:hypothetical protein ACIBAG_05885 [Streptomyces sp. NPDC051243]|uniref:hypothetical protein n=1 Tax=Streptomyces sp. NPDC051243 TaxID=3365646 RepID=UPI00378CC0A0